MLGPIGVPELIILFILIPGSLFWLWMLIDCVSKDDQAHRVPWALVIFFTHFLGAVAYFFLRRSTRVADLGE